MKLFPRFTLATIVFFLASCGQEEGKEPSEATGESSAPSADTPAEQTSRELEPSPAPVSPPILVKAGGVVQLTSDEEIAAAEREKYAAPTSGSQPMLQNLYGGVKIELPSALYNDLEPVLKELRDKLSPSDYAQLLGQVQYWWEEGRHSNEDYSPEITSTAQMRALLEKVAKAPEDTKLFPRATIVRERKEGVQFKPLVRFASGQMHYGDDRVLMSRSAVDYVWDARTEELLFCSTYAGSTMRPLRMDKNTYICWCGYGHYNAVSNPIPYIAGEMNCNVQLNVKNKTILPVSTEGRKLVPKWEANSDAMKKYGMSFVKNIEFEQSSAADSLGVSINTVYGEDEGICFVNLENQIHVFQGEGQELVYVNRWADEQRVDFRTMSHSIKASNINPLYYKASAADKKKSSQEVTLKTALKWPLTLKTKIIYDYEGGGAWTTDQVVLDEWTVGSGSEEAIAFVASATNCHDGGLYPCPTGLSEYIGVWHKGKTWIFAVPEGTQREETSLEGGERYFFHITPRGRGELIPLEKVAKQEKRSDNLLCMPDCGLLVTEPNSTDECTYILLVSSSSVSRLRVDFTKETLEFLDYWEMGAGELKPVWLAHMQILLLPASDNHCRMMRLNADGTHQELGELYVTPSDGYAIVLEDGRYAGTPGCESFLNYTHEGHTINMKALAPWRNRPAEVLEVLGGNREDIAALRETTRRWLRKQGYDVDNMPVELKPGEFPVAKVELPELFTNEEILTVPVDLRATAHDLSRLEVLRDGVRIPQPQLTESNAVGTREVSVQVPLAPGQNWIEVTPVDVAGVAGETTRFRVIRKDDTAPKLFVVALGVSDYEDDTLDLQYAAKDAQDMAKAWEDCSGMETRTLVLTNKEVKNSSVLEQIKNFLSAATISDKVVFYLAGHGMLDAKMNYYYAPASFDTERVAETGISADAIMDCLESSAAQTRVLLMDTCHAGELGEAGEDKIAMSMGNLPPGVRAIQHRGMKVRKSALSYRSKKRYIEEMFSAGSTRRGINMLSASAGAEYALETSEMQNGVFTASIIEALREPAWRDSNRDGILWVEELFHAVQDAVKTRTEGLQTPSISMMENRGYNDIAYHPGYYLQRGDYSQAVAMMKRGVKLTDDKNVRKESYSESYTLYEEVEYRSWLGKAKKHNERLFEAMLEQGVDVNQLWHFSSDEEQFKLLLQNGLDINVRDAFGKTLLMHCSTVEKARFLLEQGADIDAQDNVGRTAMDIVNGDVKEFLEEYTKAKDETAGLNAEQIRKLGADYADGSNGKDVNDQKAVQLYIQAAEMGDSTAQRWLGWRYRTGKGVDKDEQKARHYFSLAAAQGDKQAEAALNPTPVQPKKATPGKAAPKKAPTASSANSKKGSVVSKQRTSGKKKSSATNARDVESERNAGHMKEYEEYLRNLKQTAKKANSRNTREEEKKHKPHSGFNW